MKTNTIQSLFTLATLSVLAAACTANTSPTESDESSTAAATSTVKPETAGVTTGCQWNAPNSETSYTPLQYCTDFLQDNTVYASNYSGDSCNSFTTQWDATNGGGTAYTVVMSPEPATPFTATSCAQTVASMTVYGLEVTVNAAARTDTTNWAPIATTTVGGTWKSTYCSFGSLSLSFSTEIPGAAYPTIPTYQDLKVVAQVEQTTLPIIVREGAPRGVEPEAPFTTTYLPYSVHLQGEFCEPYAL